MKTENEIKKAPLFAVLFIVTSVLLIITGFVGIRQYQKNEELKAEFTQHEADLREQHADEFTEIEKNLAEITAHELVLRNSIRGNIGNTEMPESQQERIQNEIELIKSLLEENNLIIADLQSQLGFQDEQLISYKNRIKGMEKKIAGYEQDLETYMLENEELKVDLNLTRQENETLFEENNKQAVQIAEQEENLVAQNATIAEMDQANNAVYFTVGDSKQLKASGVIVNDGFLGVGTNTTLNKPVDKTMFTKVDKRSYTIIPVYSKKADLVTHHDPSSYKIIPYEGGVKWIQITDVEKFWDGSDYLVVATRDGINLGIEASAFQR